MPMEIIDQSPYPLKEGKMSLLDRIRGTLDFGLSWYPQIQAQAALTKSLSKLLNDKYILLSNITLPDVDVAIPLIIVGPTGLQVLYVTGAGGVYRAKGDSWLAQETSRGFKNARPNLLTRSVLMGRAVEIYLKRNGLSLEVQTALICVNPQMFVETIRPVVRVILSDAVENYISSLAQNKTALEPADVRRTADILVTPPISETPASAEKQTAAPVSVENTVKKNSFMAAFGKINFTRNQWIVIGVLQVLLVCFLIAFIAAVIFAK